MNPDVYGFANSLLSQVKMRASNSFSGLGLIFYRSPMRLPVASLGDQNLFRPPLPVREIDTIADVLARISVLDSPWHDGFHLIDCEASEMTHVSQFLSPPLQGVEHEPVATTPVGARQMAALLGSALPSVDCTALLTKQGAMLLFASGRVVRQA